MASPIGPSTNMVPAGSFGSAKYLPGRSPLVLRFFGAIPLAAISFLLGASVSRFGWIAVGKVSGRDPEAVFASQKV